MGRRRSFLTTLEIDIAKHAHNCQANINHRIRAGDSRLKAKEGRSCDHYCINCAIASIEGDIAKLMGLLTDLKALAGSQQSPQTTAHVET